jgi:hypothetical protein
MHFSTAAFLHLGFVVGIIIYYSMQLIDYQCFIFFYFFGGYVLDLFKNNGFSFLSGVCTCVPIVRACCSCADRSPAGMTKWGGHAFVYYTFCVLYVLCTIRFVIPEGAGCSFLRQKSAANIFSLKDQKELIF